MKSTAAALLAASLALAACNTLQPSRLVRAPQPCRDQTVQIYFEPQSAEITPEGRAVIEAAAANARRCVVRGVRVVGLADAVGSPDANLQLSERRAQSVSSVLASAGLPPAEFKIAAAGSRGAVTADGAARPVRRRADITLHLAPR